MMNGLLGRLLLCIFAIWQKMSGDISTHQGVDLQTSEVPNAGSSARGTSNQTAAALRGTTKAPPIHIVYSSDTRTFPALLVSMLSLARSLSAPSRCTIHLIVAEADLACAQNLIQCFHSELQQDAHRSHKGLDSPALLLHKMKTGKTGSANISTTTTAPAWVQRFWHTPAAYVRLHLPEYIPEDVDQVLWLDTDTVVQGDITPLVQMPMKHPIAAAYDKKPFEETYREWVTGAHDFLPPSFDENEYFFNSGVLLVNLAMWRQEKLMQQVEEKASKIPGAEDQFLLNMVFYHRFDVLQSEWNFLGLGEPPAWWQGLPRPSAKEIEAAKVLHFTGQCKPAPDQNHNKLPCVSEYDHVYHPYRLNRISLF
jgi:lipopolysaccharide biosynthesis glycosyltransferase